VPSRTLSLTLDGPRLAFLEREAARHRVTLEALVLAIVESWP
jgi:hypothetical protein